MRKNQFPDVKKQRGYGIGERNPATLPDGTSQTEREAENAIRSRYWRSRRRKVQAGSRIK